MVDGHANVKRNWMSLMDGDTDLLFIGISVSHFLIGTQELCLAMKDNLIGFAPACSLENTWANSI